MTFIRHWFHSDRMISFEGADDQICVVGVFNHSILGDPKRLQRNPYGQAWTPNNTGIDVRNPDSRPADLVTCARSCRKL